MALRRAAGVWAGLLMPLLLTTYEFIGTFVATWSFTRNFIMRYDVREKYAGTNQGIMVSTSICTIHAMAEGARLTLLYIDNLQNKSFDILLPIVSSVVWNVLMRVGCMDRILFVATRGWLQPKNASKFLRDAGYCMGYPRMGALGALLLARLCLVKSVVIGEMEQWLWVFIIGAELLEDLVSYILWWAGVDLSPVKRFATDTEVEQMSEKKIVRRLSGLGQQRSSGALAVIPVPSSRKSTQSSASDDADDTAQLEVQRLATVESVKWEVRESHDFNYGPVDFGQLPFWAHLLPAAMSQFHTVLAMIAFSNGFVYLLGFCRHDEMSPEAGVFWWPIPDSEMICV
ncbi:unnamed protein product [Symbiodinium sp. CCMP2592]|nr:unnamed protein product [Symbiodinium sp. CCMP2592]